MRCRGGRAPQPGVHGCGDRGRGRSEVSVWLTGEAAWFALPDKAEEFELAYAAPLADQLGAVLAGGSVTLCTQCSVRREITESDVRAGIVIAGAPSFVEEALGEIVQALVY